jgi:hypothetical protein
MDKFKLQIPAKAYETGSTAAVDVYGRFVPTAASPRNGKTTCIFYFLTGGQHSGNADRIYDVTQLSMYKPEELWNPEGTENSPVTASHYWGEPLFGYYDSEDEYVLRRHAKMLTYADIDFLIFDTTNHVTYDNVCLKLMEIFDEYRLQGFKVPKFAYYTNTESGDTINHLYELIYKPGKYKELWYTVNGKPLIAGVSADVSKEISDFFYFKESQWPNVPDVANGFPWIDWRIDQKNYEGIVNVSVSQHNDLPFSNVYYYPDTHKNRGRGWDGEKNCPEGVDKGYNFERQWKNALSMDPDMVFVTGWNEWTMGKWIIGEGKDKKIFFVDNYNKEYSRDAEPMNGGYADSYYLQLIKNNRLYKYGDIGNTELGKFAGITDNEIRSIDIFGDIKQWENVKGIYADFKGDAAKRNFKGAIKNLHYVDNSGRNDFTDLRVACDKENIYFMALTDDVITAWDGQSENWMNLLFSVDYPDASGFGGFKYIVNRHPGQNEASLEISMGGYHWQKIADVKCRICNNTIQISVPRRFVEAERRPFKLYFKWADNIQKPDDINDYYVSGDSAPIGRLAYAFGCGF